MDRLSCQNQLRQIALGVHQYHDVNKIIPYNSLSPEEGYGPKTHAWSWMSLILPYVDQNSLYISAKIPENTLYESKTQVAQQVKLFLCPSDSVSANGPREDAADLGMWNPPSIPAGQTNFKGVSGANWAWGENRWRKVGANGSDNGLAQGDGIFFRHDYLQKKGFSSVTDGLSNTFMVGEALPEKSKWCAWPYANTSVATCAIGPNATQDDGTPVNPWNWENSYGFFSKHHGGINFAFADGSSRFISLSTDLDIYRAFATIAGGETK